MVQKLKSKLSPEVYTDLDNFVMNNTNFTEPQKEKFIKLLESIHADKKESDSLFPIERGGSRDWG